MFFQHSDSRRLLHIASLRTENRNIGHGSCKALNFLLVIHFNASVTFLLRVLEIL